MRRRALMTVSGGALEPLPVFPAIPSDYQRIEYIESNGDVMYTITGIVLSNNVQTVYAKPTNTTVQNWFTDRSGVSSFQREIKLSATEYGVFHYSEITYDIGNRYNTFSGKGGSGYATARAAKILSNDATGKFFGITHAGQHYVIPCIRKADNAIGLYFTQNSQFYANEGTGTPIAGPDVT